MGFIYRIVNDVNGKSYIGKTEHSIDKRFREHCLEAFQRRSENRPLYAAMRKYGTEHFYIDLIEEIDDLEDREKYWIEYFDTYQNGYNATLGGDGKRLYDYDQILGELIFSSDADLIAQNIGCCRDTVANVAAQHGITVTKDVSKNFGDVNLIRRKRVCALSVNSDIFAVFDSISDAAKWLFENGNTKSQSKSVVGHISDCAKGRSKHKTAYGFYWQFV